MRRAPGEGRERFMRMSGGHSKASRKRVTPLSKSGTVYENVRWTFESEQGCEATGV